ncbi:slipin family protein, partial [Streptomyces sp. SAS_267]
VVAVAAEKNSTLVLPFPVELLRFLERAQSGQQPTVPQPQPQPQPEPQPESQPESRPERSTASE